MHSRNPICTEVPSDGVLSELVNQRILSVCQHSDGVSVQTDSVSVPLRQQLHLILDND